MHLSWWSGNGRHIWQPESSGYCLGYFKNGIRICSDLTIIIKKKGAIMGGWQPGIHRNEKGSSKQGDENTKRDSDTGLGLTSWAEAIYYLRSSICSKGLWSAFTSEGQLLPEYRGGSSVWSPLVVKASSCVNSEPQLWHMHWGADCLASHCWICC